MIVAIINFNNVIDGFYENIVKVNNLLERSLKDGTDVYFMHPYDDFDGNHGYNFYKLSKEMKEWFLNRKLDYLDWDLYVYEDAIFWDGSNGYINATDVKKKYLSCENIETENIHDLNTFIEEWEYILD